MNSLAREQKRETNMPAPQPTVIQPLLESNATPGVQANQSLGQALDSSLRAELEPKFAYSFENVRIYADPYADALAREVDARAFTVGQDVFFRQGEYAPATTQGREVLTHELAHTVQQQNLQPTVSAPFEFATESAETEAQHATNSVLAGESVALTSSSMLAIARLKPGETASSVSESDQKRMQQVDERMSKISTAAAARGTALGATSDKCIGDLRGASSHLRESNDNYKKGHQIVTDVLKRADKEYEFDKSVEDAVQGVLIAAALAVLAPEAIVATGVVKGLTVMAESTSSRLVTLGLTGLVMRNGVAATAAEGAVGEIAEQVTGGGANASKSGDGGRPSDSAGQAGATPGERYEEAFGHLDRMIGFLPKVGGTSSIQHNIAHGADRLSKAAIKAGAGQTAEWSMAEIEQKASQLEEIEKENQNITKRADQLGNEVLSIKNQILAIKIETPSQIEDRLWNAWMANLSGDAHNMLDNDVLEKYLGPEGKKLFDFGSYTSDSDTQGAVVDAQKRWLKDNNIEPGNNITSQYNGHRHMMDLKNRVVGKRGKIAGRRSVEIGGNTFTYPGNSGELDAGTEVIALHITFKQHMNLGDLNVAQWTDNDFDVYCNKLSDMPQAVQPEQ
jgi:Domain of unknown function (DUF4157)